MTAGADSTTVVLIHGWPVTNAHWRFLGPALEGAGSAVCTVTLPGLGPHPDLTSPDFRKITLARALLRRLADRGIERCAIAGHDWGATVGTLAAALAPDAVSCVVVEEEILPGVAVDVPEPGRDHYPTWHGPFNRAPGLAERLVPGREQDYYGIFLRQSAGPPGLDPAIEAEYVAAYSAPDMLAAGLAYYRSQQADVRDLAAMAWPLRVPVLAVGGRYGMGPAVAAGMRTLANAVQPAVLDDAGHYPAEQVPAQFTPLVLRFLAGRS